MIPKTIIHLMSGGLDSTTMLYDLVGKGHNVHCLMVDYQQKHAQEITFARIHCRKLCVMETTIDLPPLGGLSDESWIVPNRNAILIHCAVNLAVKAGADTVTIGCNAGDAEDFPDCRPEFIRSINESVRLAGYNVEICAPYIDWQKWKIAALSREIGVPSHLIWSCYRGGGQQCGKCPACVRLFAALEESQA